MTHAETEYPNESCGLISGEKYFKSINVHDIPSDNFIIQPEVWIDAENQSTVTAIVHSHPQGAPILSMSDMLSQQKTKIDWWVTYRYDEKWNIKKYRYCKPLLGRNFSTKKMDCYTLIRDAYMLSGIDLPDYDRNDNWWEHGKNLYLDNITKYFDTANNTDIKVGDIILMKIGAKVANHAAIYIGDDMVLHHCAGRLSCRDKYDGYWRKYTHSIWRIRKWQSYDFTGILNNLAINL